MRTTPTSRYQQTEDEGPIENVDYWQSVSTGYTETLGIPIVEGRSFLPPMRGDPWPW
jgi:hypothetical protein